MVSRIGVILSNDPRVQDLPTSLDGVTPEDHKMVDVPLFGADVRRAFIFKARRPSATLPQSLVGAASQA